MLTYLLSSGKKYVRLATKFQPWDNTRGKPGELAILIEKLIQSAYKAAAILAIGLSCGLAFNQFRPGGLDLLHFKARVPDDPEKQEHIIPLDMAAALFADKKAVFIDARPASLYEKGHIKGALSLPWNEAEEKFVYIADKLPENKIIITYCDGIACELSSNLADFLESMGFKNVRVLINGWSLWKKNRLPAEKGKQPE